jgi:hypothetical protein
LQAQGCSVRGARSVGERRTNTDSTDATAAIERSTCLQNVLRRNTRAAVAARNSDERAAAKAWDEWADARIARFLAENPFSETQRETLGVVIAEIRRELREEFGRQLAAREEKMNDELAALRVADAITRSLIGGRGNVLPIDDTIVRKNLKSDASLEIEEAKKQDVA